jgi:anti-sigma factor (TIGR02949 family)
MSFVGGFGPGNIDCDDVIKDLYLYLDDESDIEVRNRIRQHLDACAPCLRQYGLEQDVRSLLRRRPRTREPARAHSGAHHRGLHRDRPHRVPRRVGAQLPTGPTSAADSGLFEGASE